jgi:phenylalanyl-tRNA synthetase beta chain
MRAPLSWLREYVDLPAGVTASDVAHRLTALGLKLEALHGADVTGPLVAGRVVSYAEEPQRNGRTIRWCRVDVGPAHNGPDGSRGIVCGASNFAEGDPVVVALPGAVLPGGAISARKTYGHVSDGMICSAKELGIGEDHSGIIVLAGEEAAAAPGDDAVALLGLDDEVIELEINPDRAYALSLRGVAREAALAYGVAFHDPARRDAPAAGSGLQPVRVEDPDGCPVFVARTVTGFNPAAPSPRWLARRVQLAGMRSISLAVDVSNYVMLELGQPNHTYDADLLSGAIVVRRARDGERLTTLDGADRALTPQDLLIADERQPIGLAGVMGGATTEISDRTTRIVVEAAHFDPVTVFRAQRRHRLPSEASRRFERGVDPLLPPYAADRVAHLLVELGGGTVEPVATYVGAPPPAPEVTIAADLPARVTGIRIDPDTALRALTQVGCVVDTRDPASLTARVPSWRPDLTDAYDLVEEVARVVGYAHVPSVLPAAPPGRGLTREQRLRRRAARTLAGLGLVEVKTYPFVGEAALEALGLPADDGRRRTVRLANPLSDEEPALTTTLLPGLLRVAARNVGRGQPDLGVFEVAAVFWPASSGAGAPVLPVHRRPTDAEVTALEDALPWQPRHVGVVLAGEREASGWWGAGRAAEWADAVQVARLLAAGVGAEIDVARGGVAPWHPGRCARLTVGGVEAGFAGELHPRVCDRFGLPPRAVALEVDLDALVEAAVAVPRAPRFSTMPVAKEDVALVVDRSVPAADVAHAIRAGAGPLLESVRLFDVYTGPQVAEGRKSLAFALRFRAPDRTLTEEETGAARQAAVASAAERCGAVQRA